MCGIVGLWNPLEFDTDPTKLLEGMLGTIEHRGPDEFGYYLDASAGIGSARLSIIDIQSGTQPISSLDGQYWIVFNGEIFNYIELRVELINLGYIFRSKSDTEVLLYSLIEWGTSALSKLDGQYAFAFYNNHANELLLGRDPFGEKPLFYTHVKRGLAFASEIKALFYLSSVPRNLSINGLSMAYFSWTTTPSETCFEGVHQLPHGHFIKISPNGMVLTRYFNLNFEQTNKNLDIHSASTQLVSILDASIKRRLRSDVPVGLYLSGGLDSTIVASLAHKNMSGEIHSFSIEFEEDGFDESAWQKQTIDKFATTHHSILIKPADIANNFLESIWHAETVQFRTALIPMMMLSKLVKNFGVKVVITGEGADEAFLGYDIFKESMLRSNWNNFQGYDERLSALRSLYHYLPEVASGNGRLLMAYFQQHLKTITPGLFSHETRLVNGRSALSFLKNHEPESSLRSRLARLIFDHDCHKDNIMGHAQILEYETLLAGYLLSSQGDRMTSSSGIESRSPFLSTAVINFANSLPLNQKLSDNFTEKLILKNAFLNFIPNSIASRPKQPYRAPGALCFLGKNSPLWISDFLNRKHLSEINIFNVEPVLNLINKLKKGPINRISAKDDQAFILILSTVALWNLFVNTSRPSTKNISDRCKLRINRINNA